MVQASVLFRLFPVIYGAPLSFTIGEHALAVRANQIIMAV
jgi:hypothetical protein